MHSKVSLVDPTPCSNRVYINRASLVMSDYRTYDDVRVCYTAVAIAGNAVSKYALNMKPIDLHFPSTICHSTGYYTRTHGYSLLAFHILNCNIDGRPTNRIRDDLVTTPVSPCPFFIQTKVNLPLTTPPPWPSG